MSPVAAPSDRRFRRSHVKPARRRKRWALLRPLLKYTLAGALLVFVLYQVGSAVAHAGVLSVDSIIVEGNARMSSADVLRAVDGLNGENILLSDLHAWRDHLLRSPWVKSATLRRTLPSTIQISIEERAPIAVGRFGDALYLVDEHGVVVDTYGPTYADLDLPIVEGLGPARTEIGATTDRPKAALASRVISGVAAKPDIAGRVSQIDVRDVRNAAVTLSGDAALLYLGDDQFLPRIESYLELASRLREFVPDIDYVDMRFGDQVIVRPAKGAARTVVRTSLAAPATRATPARATRLKPKKR